MKKNLFSTMLALLTIVAMLVSVGCKNYDDDISDINKKLSSVEGTLSTVSGQVTTLQSTVSSLQSTVDALKAEVAKCAKPEDVAKMQSQIDALNAAIKTANEAIADNTKAIEQNGKDIKEGAAYAAATYATISALAEANAAIAAVQSEVEEVKAAVAKVAEAIAETIAEIQSQIEAIKAALENYYTKEQIDEMLTEIIAGGTFTIKSVATTVHADFYIYKWYAPSTSAKKAMVAKVAAVYPEVAEYEAGDMFTYGTSLPFFVNPKSADMSDFSFALVDSKGFDYGVKFGKAFAGIADGYWDGPYDDYNTTKAANDGAWSVTLESPLYNKDGDVIYNHQIDHLALVATNDDASAQTSFAYSISCGASDTKDFEISAYNRNVEYSKDGINLTDAGIYTVTGANVYRKVFESADTKAQIERYNISIKGDVLTLDEPETGVEVKILTTAVGMNGVADTTKSILWVYKKVEEKEIPLTDAEVTLSSTSAVYAAWDVAQLGLSVSELSDFIKATKLYPGLFAVEMLNKDEVSVKDAYLDGFYFLDKDKAPVTSGTYDEMAEKVVYFGTKVKVDKAVPGTYAMSVKYYAYPINYIFTSNLTIKNPEAQQVKLIDALCKDGVLQVVGTGNGTTVTYDLARAFVTADNGATSTTGMTFVDADWAKSEFTDEVPSWVSSNTTLVIPVNDNASEVTSGSAKPFPAHSKLLYTERNITAKYAAFKNADNVRELPFKLVVISPCYTDDATKVQVADQNIYFKDPEGKGINKFTIDKIYKSAVYVAGTYTGQSYKFYNTVKKNGGKTTSKFFVLWDNGTCFYVPGQGYVGELPTPYTGSKNVNNLSTRNDAQTVGGVNIDASKWILTESNNFYEIPLNSIPNATLQGFGFSVTEVASMKAAAGKDKLYLTESMLINAYAGWNGNKGWEKYYYKDGTKADPSQKIAEEDANQVAAYEYVKAYFTYKTGESTTDAYYSVDKVASEHLYTVMFAFDDVELAKKYFDLDGDIAAWDGIDALYLCGLSHDFTTDHDFTSCVKVKSTVDPVALGITDKIVFPATVTITDKWGMKMVKNLNVTVSVNK